MPIIVSSPTAHELYEHGAEILALPGISDTRVGGTTQAGCEADMATRVFAAVSLGVPLVEVTYALMPGEKGTLQAHHNGNTITGIFVVEPVLHTDPNGVEHARADGLVLPATTWEDMNAWGQTHRSLGTVRVVDGYSLDLSYTSKDPRVVGYRGGFNRYLVRYEPPASQQKRERKSHKQFVGDAHDFLTNAVATARRALGIPDTEEA